MSSDVAWRDSGDDGAGEARAQQAQNFVNHGLNRWERTRKLWIAGDTGDRGQQPSGRRRSRSRARMMDVDEIIDDLFSGSGGSGHLPHSVPLPQMIDLLVDLWEAEGLFD
ncbi:unnamed protein product [Ascophyllum nodosum]